MPSDKLKLSGKLAEAIGRYEGSAVNLMEVCGTHTHAIAKAGIKSVLPAGVTLLSGPGCPVCVTPAEVIDKVLELAMNPEIIIASYGDMVRVPGTKPGDSLNLRRAKGARVEIVYSAVDAVELAERNPDRQVVFLGVGFETTAPGTAAAVLTAKEKGVKNFTVWSMLKTVEPALRALIETEGFSVNGFLLPGHVATIIGEKGFRFLADEYAIPSVISGFETEDILASVYALLRQMEKGEARLLNEYTRAVRPEGNLAAQRMMDMCFTSGPELWRGMGMIENSGLKFREELAQFDAEKRFSIEAVTEEKKTACSCGDVITGRIRPQQCRLFGGRCSPEDPVGPCMVSSEGACSAAYKYSVI